jgi:hypothetical protein
VTAYVHLVLAQGNGVVLHHPTCPCGAGGATLYAPITRWQRFKRWLRPRIVL